METPADEKKVECLGPAHEAPITKKRLLAAERMRRHRERRREGLRSYRIDLREAEVDELVRTGFLDPEKRHDYYSVVEAVYGFLDEAFRRT